MRRPDRLLCLALSLAFLAFSSAGAAEPAMNIVLVMADDVGLGDIGLYHKERTGTEPLAPTPHLDALARAGMRFSDAHSTTALCSPTRYSVMSGNLTYRCYAPWGVWGSFRPTPFKATDATVGRVGQGAGMTTAFLGKWHLGGDYLQKDGKAVYRGADRGDEPLPVDATRCVGGGPRSVGFDYSYTLPCGIQGPLYVAYENGRWSPFADDSELIHYDKQSASDPLFVSDKGPGVGDSAWDTRRIGPLLSSKAVDFMRESTDAGRPFLLYYCSPMVHVPHAPPEEFDGRPVRGQTPSRHLDMMIDLDQQVGRMVAELKRSGQFDNTLFVFTSDNGGLLDGRAKKRGHDSSNGLRGSKNLPYEGGHRVPLFVVWPGRVEAGSTCDRPVAAHDLVATFAAATGQTLGEEQAMDSLNLLPLLLGEGDPTERRPDFLLQGGSHHEVIYRSGSWKLIIQSNYKADRWEPIALFDLEANPTEHEAENLIDRPEHASQVDKMFSRYRELRESGARTAPLGA
ncbi:sulfatase family protein [Botrimarina hoheduenensis]|uniref:Arylsulfatase n=1 Tax=Botrimarina hoheduenensis TaxID=2528000 RepID=A0A5C5VRA3_9BACT|nr:arylsulfatase [Botrimarina hoheduenensis]TWT40633.1 Arylsulfatase [Botrimarina hoheduenensis]